MKLFRQSLFILVSGLIAILLGFTVSMKWMGQARSQAPTEDLPPELSVGSAPTAPAKPAPPQQPATTKSVPSAPLKPGSEQSGPQTTTSEGLVELPNSLDQTDTLQLDAYVQPKAASDGYIYDPTGRRDPFRPYLSNGKLGIGNANLKIEETPAVELEPLQFFDLGNLEIVGILWNVARPRVLIRDPNKVIHTVKKGQKIGKNEGYVAEIREGEIVVIETYDNQGKLVKDARVMSIKR